MQYLTNIEPATQYERKLETHDDVAFRVYAAALRSGQNVIYLTCAMPYHWTSKDPSCNSYGCIVGIDDEHDYSRFWQEYDKL